MKRTFGRRHLKRRWRDAGGGSPTVLITDVELPEGIDGSQIAERCREDHRKLRVITSRSARCPESLMLQKPSCPEDIVSAVRRVASDRA
ncbi:hypothetical protein [Bradyrhizobium sp. BR 1432]|uniref:hypothetical protein n=1 Tax=Bradyrhizobium sp. BR 1432 TaxID=3447966 RepID=UPI003EE757D2